MTHALSAEEKQIFKSATERRREAGIRLGRISFMATKEQVESFNELFDSWVSRWGKNKAVDVLLSMMSGIEARLRDGETK